MQGEVVDALPRCGLLGALFLPDKDLAVIARRCKDVTVLGMGPCNTPDGSLVSAKDQLLPLVRLSLKIPAPSQTDAATLFHNGAHYMRLLVLCWGISSILLDVPFECLNQALRLALDFEDLDGPIAGAGGQFPAVVVENGIVLWMISHVRSWARGTGFVQSCHRDRSC